MKCILRSLEWRLALLAFAAAACGAPEALAQQQPPAPASSPAARDPQSENAETAATSRFIEAYRVGEWDKAEKYFLDLVDRWPRVPPGRRVGLQVLRRPHQARHAEQEGRGRGPARGPARTRPGQHRYMYLLAQIKAQSDRPASKEEAKALLLNAARHGFYTLREIMSSKDETFEIPEERSQVHPQRHEGGPGVRRRRRQGRPRPVRSPRAS